MTPLKAFLARVTVSKGDPHILIPTQIPIWQQQCQNDLKSCLTFQINISLPSFFLLYFFMGKYTYVNVPTFKHRQDGKGPVSF